MKVLFLCDGLHPGGKQRRMLQLLKHLAGSHGMQPLLVLMSDEIRYPEVYELGIPLYFFARRYPRDLRPFRQLFQLCSSVRPDLVHSWDPLTSLFGAPSVWWLNLRFVNGMVTNAPPRLAALGSTARIARRTFQLANAVVGNSLAGLRAYRVPASKAVCIHNGFDPARLRNVADRAVIRAELGIQTPFAVGMVAEFADKKDYATYLHAAQQVLARRNDVSFLAVGTGRNLARMKSLVAPAYSGRIIFTDWRADAESVMNAFDVGVLATDAGLHGEGIPNVVLEYMALGLPVIATDAGGTRELVAHGTTGRLVQNGDAADISRSIEMLLDDPVRARSMGDAGKARVLHEFSMQRMTDRFLELYASIVDTGCPSPQLLAQRAGASL
jgi:glycosyltransferase involved in cell wall biosynthesis